MRWGRLIRLTDEDMVSWRDHCDDKDSPEETAAVACRFLDANGIPPKSRPADAGGVEAEGHPPSLVLRQKRSQTGIGKGWLSRVDNGGAGSPVRLNDQWAS
jgi:hypothetical protein